MGKSTLSVRYGKNTSDILALIINVKIKVPTPMKPKPLADEKCNTSPIKYSAKAAKRTPQKLKKLAVAIICPRLALGLLT